MYICVTPVSKNQSYQKIKKPFSIDNLFYSRLKTICIFFLRKFNVCDNINSLITYKCVQQLLGKSKFNKIAEALVLCNCIQSV